MAKDFSKSLPAGQAGLPEDVAAKYSCATMPGVFVTKHPDRVKVDLRRISVTQADELVKAGKLPQLVLRKVKKDTAASTAAGDPVDSDWIPDQVGDK